MYILRGLLPAALVVSILLNGEVAILSALRMRTIVQAFFIEVGLLILDTKDCQHLRLVDFIVRLALARMMRRFLY